MVTAARCWSRGLVIHWAIVPTSLGALTVAATDKGLCRLAFNESRGDLAQRFSQAILDEKGSHITALLPALITIAENGGHPARVPLDLRGTAFQIAVWNALKQIPVGETRSYAQIAAAIGRPRAVRAVGSANAANPIAVLIPCHRVVRSDGDLGGYAYGTEIKQKLLARERVI